MKKICLALFVMLMPLSFAIMETSIYKGIALDGKAILASKKEFSFRFDYASKQAIVESEFGSWFIAQGECKIKNNIDICVSNITLAYRNATTLQDVYSAEVEIYKITADLEVTHELEPEEVRVGESTRGTISLENKADIAAENVLLQALMPEQLTLIGADGCNMNGNKVELKTTIAPKKKIQCKYDALAAVAGKMQVLANVSFFDGLESITVVEQVSGKVLSPALNITAPKNISVESGSVLPLTILLENRDEEFQLKVSLLSILIPQTFSIIKKPVGMSFAQNKLSWSGTLEPKESMNISIELQLKRSGAHELMVEAAYSENNLARKQSLQIPMNVTCTCPTIEESKDQLLLVNPNPTQTFKDILATIDGLEKRYASLSPQAHLLLGESSAEKVVVQFVSETGERFSITKKVPLEAIPSKKPAENKTPEKETVKNQTVDANPNLQRAEQNQSSNVTKVQEVMTELKKPISAKAILIGGSIAGGAFLITTLFLLRKRRHMEVKGKTLEDIEQELKKMQRK